MGFQFILFRHEKNQFTFEHETLQFTFFCTTFSFPFSAWGNSSLLFRHSTLQFTFFGKVISVYFFGIGKSLLFRHGNFSLLFTWDYNLLFGKEISVYFFGWEMSVYFSDMSKLKFLHVENVNMNFVIPKINRTSSGKVNWNSPSRKSKLKFPMPKK